MNGEKHQSHAEQSCFAELKGEDGRDPGEPTGSLIKMLSGVCYFYLYTRPLFGFGPD